MESLCFGERASNSRWRLQTMGAYFLRRRTNRPLGGKSVANKEISVIPEWSAEI